MRAQIVLENVAVRFPNRVLFEGVNWTLYEGMRVTLAGRNGCGKSTLMKILAGQNEPTEGSRTVVGGRRLRIGYLDQSLLDSAVLQAQAESDQSQSVVSYLRHHLEDRRDEEEGEFTWEIRKMLSGLGFTEPMMDGALGALSGGWLLRVFIANALLQKPEVLLLDEPTNHLDLSSIQWLEQFLLKEYKGTLVLISHDVTLQRKVTDSIAILHGANFYFDKSTRDYLSFRESLGSEEENVRRQIERAEKKRDELMDFVVRFRAKANVASRAQSKLKEAERLEREIAALKDRLERVKGFAYELRFRFRTESLGSKFPLALSGVKFRYTEHGPWILKDVSLDIKRGQKVAIIGDNGAGKTTLLAVMAGELKPTEGTVSEGYGVETGYFGQHQLDQLSLEDTILDNLRSRADGIPAEKLRGWLGAFGFSGDDEIQKKAKVLSGGERARLALLRLLVTPINLCLLDEPTNHLDVETKELLKKAIKSFEGTAIFVSHDREFVSGIAERIIYLSVDHQVTDHLGDLDSFFEKYPQFVRQLDGATARKPSTPAPASSGGNGQDKRLMYEERKQRRNRLKILERSVGQLEADIDSLGEEKERLQRECDAEMFYAPDNEARRNEVFARLAEIDRAIGSKMSEWEKASLELETLKAD